MNLLRYGALLLIATLASATAFAQNTIGELMAAGGKQLSKDEVLATLSGSSASGQLANGGETQIDWNANGSVSGYMTNATGRRGSIYGTWKVDDEGKICRELTIKFYESSQVKDCFPVFRLGDQIYFPGPYTTIGPSVAIVKRTIKRQ
jgi:hypothetical protein